MIYPSLDKPRWKKIKYNTNGIPFIADFSLGNGTMFRLISFKTPHRLFVGLERIGCFLFDMQNWKHHKYVAEKLSLMPEGSDCKNIADWINVQLGHEVDEVGDYRYFEEKFINQSPYPCYIEPEYE